MGDVKLLQCVTCGQGYSPAQTDTTCPACGPVRGTLEVLYDYETAARRLTRDSLARDHRFDMWRYQPLLPVSDAENIPPLAVGGSPLYRARRLAEELGLEALWVKDDGRNPSASLKDRASAVAAAKAREKGVRVVTAASTGNAAASWAAFAAVAGLRAVIFVPQHAPPAKLAQLLICGATVLQVHGTYDQAFDLCCEAAAEWGWYNRSTAVNPYLGEGKKTAAFELCEQLDWEPPDYVFVGVGDGCIYQGLWKGFKEFFTLGLIERPPRLIGVQAEGAAPLVKAWQSRAAEAESQAVRTLADSIAVGTPRDQVKCLKAARESGGGMVAVSDSEILQAISQLALTTGVMSEPAGAVGLAGLKRLVSAGTVTSRHRVAVMVTGSGLKDIDNVRRAAVAEPLAVEPSLPEVEKSLAAAGVFPRQ